MDNPLPDPSTLSYFRGRLGAFGHRKVFDAIVAQARAHGLVKDRLVVRVTHLEEILAWIDELSAADDQRGNALRAARELAHKILCAQQPNAKDRGWYTCFARRSPLR